MTYKFPQLSVEQRVPWDRRGYISRNVMGAMVHIGKPGWFGGRLLVPCTDPKGKQEMALRVKILTMLEGRQAEASPGQILARFIEQYSRNQITFSMPNSWYSWHFCKELALLKGMNFELSSGDCLVIRAGNEAMAFSSQQLGLPGCLF